jgi:diacylglycerol O-acyltransferase / wax synthase
VSDNRLTPLDASFLTVESPTAHMHVGWACLFARPPGRASPTFEDLRDHIEGRLGGAPRYRQKLADVPLGVGEPVWVDDEQFDVGRHVLRSPRSRFGDVVDKVMSTPLARNRPLWEVWVADTLDDGRIGVVGKVHHCMVDGIAAVELAALLVDPTPEPPGPRRVGWQPGPTPPSSRRLADAVVGGLGDAIEVAGAPLRLARHPSRLAAVSHRGAQTVRAAAQSLRPATSSPVFNEPISPQRHLAVLHRPLDELREMGGCFGTTVNDVVLAVTAGGIRRFLELRGETPVRLKTMVPVNLRAQGGEAGLGNQISFVFVDLPCDESNPVRRLREVHLAMCSRKHEGVPEGADVILKAFGHTPRQVRQAVSRMIASPRSFNLTVSNIPGPTDRLYMMGCELEEVYPVVPIADRHAVSIGVTTVNGGAFFGIYVDPDSLPDADAMATAIGESIDELGTRLHSHPLPGA